MNRRLVVVTDRNAHPVFCPGVADVAGQAELSEVLLKDTLDVCALFDAGRPGVPELILAYHGERAWYQPRVSSFWLLLPQMGNTVAQWLDNTLIGLAPQPEDQTVFLGTRTPHLPVRVLEQAFDGLGRFEAVIGACEEEGVYLLGVRGRWPTGALAQVDWEGNKAVSSLRQAFRRAHASYAMVDRLDPLYAKDDLEKLRPLLLNYPDSCLKNTRHYLRNHELL